VVRRCRVQRSKRRTTSLTHQNHKHNHRASSLEVPHHSPYTSLITTKQTNISLSSTKMPASPGDPSEWEHFSWTPAEEPTPTESSSSSESSASSSASSLWSDGVTPQLGDPDDLLSIAPLIAGRLMLRDQVAAARRASGRFSYYEWLRRHPHMPRRPQYGLVRMIVMRVWGWLGRAEQKFVDTWWWNIG
jgi:hypothetical protein